MLPYIAYMDPMGYKLSILGYPHFTTPTSDQSVHLRTHLMCLEAGDERLNEPGGWVETYGYHMGNQHSMAWFKGKSTGNHGYNGFYHQIWVVPIIFHIFSIIQFCVSHPFAS